VQSDPETVFVPATETVHAGVDDATLAVAQARLTYKLPAAYVALLRVRNGGDLRRTRCETDFATSWAPDHFVVESLVGVGQAALALDGDTGSDYMIREWGYPDIGLVVGVTPSAGHDTVMLDYRDCDPDSEPRVVYVDEDRIPRIVAESFGAFIDALASG